MGSGKSYLGQRLANILNWDFVDMDAYLEAQEGKTISQIFEESGEPFFRALEKKYLHSTLNFDKTIVATGGGAPCFFDNIQWMKQHGQTIYLKTPTTVLVNRLKSVGYAFKGALLLLKTEASIKIQFTIAIIVTVAGFYFNISTNEWVAQVLAIGLVMTAEGMNTAIEEIANFIHPERHDKIGLIKDIAAGAVFIASIFSSIVGLIIYLPKIF